MVPNLGAERAQGAALYVQKVRAPSMEEVQILKEHFGAKQAGHLSRYKDSGL